jgi:hypothetical protein
MAGNSFTELEERFSIPESSKSRMCCSGVQLRVRAISFNVLNSLANLLAAFGGAEQMLFAANQLPAERLAGSCQSVGMKPNYKKQDETNDFGN